LRLAKIIAAVAAGMSTFLMCSAVAVARDNALQSACFPPETLKAVPGERNTAKGNRQFDQSEKPRTLNTFQPLSADLRGSIRRVDVPGGRKVIALTFDMCEIHGEISGYDGDVFDYLRSESVKATLFTGGKWMRSHLSRAQQLMTDPLFEIASHGHAHRNIRKLSGEPMLDEILGPQRAYEAIREGFSKTQCAKKAENAMQSVAPRISLYRFPFGACNEAALKAVNDAGLAAVQWDVSIGDADKGSTAIVLAARMVRNAKPGSIIIAHANGRGWNTAEALRIAIPKLKAKGFEFVTVSELLTLGKPVVASSCYDNRPGDTDRYDFLFAKKPATDSGWMPTGILPDQPPSPPKKKKQPPASDWNPHVEPFRTN
jgi:peptidoglycan-N-acetylglucosamine deacetylase